MPIYEFVHEKTGEPAEVFYERMEGPEGPPLIGERIPNTPLKRVISMPVKPVVREIHFEAHSQPPWAAGAPSYSQTGVPQFQSRRQVESYVETQNALVDKDGMGEQGGEYLAYDAAPTSEDHAEWKRKGETYRPATRKPQTPPGA
jgi:hypothetical protein